MEFRRAFCGTRTRLNQSFPLSTPFCPSFLPMSSMVTPAQGVMSSWRMRTRKLCSPSCRPGRMERWCSQWQDCIVIGMAGCSACLRPCTVSCAKTTHQWASIAAFVIQYLRRCSTESCMCHAPSSYVLLCECGGCVNDELMLLGIILCSRLHFNRIIPISKLCQCETAHLPIPMYQMKYWALLNDSAMLCLLDCINLIEELMMAFSSELEHCSTKEIELHCDLGRK